MQSIHGWNSIYVILSYRLSYHTNDKNDVEETIHFKPSGKLMIIVIFVMNDRQSKKDLFLYIEKSLQKSDFSLTPMTKMTEMTKILKALKTGLFTGQMTCHQRKNAS